MYIEMVCNGWVLPDENLVIPLKSLTLCGKKAFFTDEGHEVHRSNLTSIPAEK